MAVRSRDFVGIAEGIRSHELSTKSQIENLKGRMSELSGRRSSLNSTISYLEAAIAAAYEDTDEDGDPDYGLIASLEAQKSSTENELSGVENDLDSTGNELENKQNELEMVEEEKAQTLFEIQERARKTSNNISLAGGMYGAYAGVGGTLQNSLQTSLSSLTQAAGILGGSVDGASGGSLGGPSGSGNAASGEVGTSLGDNGSGTGPLSAFTGGYSGEALPLSASQFSTNQDQVSTPATMPNYHSGQGSINTRAPQSFSTEQGANEYALSSFGDVTAPQVTFQSADGYRSNQASQNMESQFTRTDSSALGASSSTLGNRQHSFADWLNPDNYTEDGHYFGEGQSWGYKPYGNDTSEYAATIMTPAQQALNSYMQEHNYGKWDYGTYSKDPTWQKLHKATYQQSVQHNKKSPQERLQQYMYEHNYGWDDYITYSRDPVWQRLRQEINNISSKSVGNHIVFQYQKDFSDLEPTVSGLRNKINAFINKVINKSNVEQTSSGIHPVNQILSGKFPDNNLRYTTLAGKTVGELTEKELTEIKNLALDTLISQYGSFFSKQAFTEAADRIEFLTKEEIEYKYPTADSTASGFHIAGKVVIRKKADTPVAILIATSCHEILHFLSYTNSVNGVVDDDNDTVVRISNNNGSSKKVRVSRNTGFNEGITEWLASENMKTMNELWNHVSYPDQVEIVSRLAQICGKDKLLTIYSKHNVTPLHSIIGEEQTLVFCRKMDELHIYSSAKKANEVKRVKAELNAILDRVTANASSHQEERNTRYNSSLSDMQTTVSTNTEKQQTHKKQSSLDYIVLRNKPGFTDEEQRQHITEILAKQKGNTSTGTSGSADEERERERVPWEK